MSKDSSTSSDGMVDCRSCSNGWRFDISAIIKNALANMANINIGTAAEVFAELEAEVSDNWVVCTCGGGPDCFDFMHASERRICDCWTGA
jgi:hypothetical protein